MYKTHDKSAQQQEPSPPRAARLSPIRQPSQSPPARYTTDRQHEIPAATPYPHSPERDAVENELPVNPSTVARPWKADENGVHSTTRVKRIGLGAMGAPVSVPIKVTPTD